MKKSLVCNSCGKRFRVDSRLSNGQPSCPTCGTGDVAYAKRGFQGVVSKRTKFIVGEGRKSEKVRRVKLGLPNIDDVLEGL